MSLDKQLGIEQLLPVAIEADSSSDPENIEASSISRILVIIQISELTAAFVSPLWPDCGDEHELCHVDIILPS